MIAKIVTGKSFGGAVRYLLEKSGHARMLDSDGIDTRSIKDMIGSFNFQRKARPEKAEVVGHISLSFHKNDAPRLTDEFMTELAREYMQRMGITDTQHMIVRHTDTEHPHLHILYNRVKYDAKLVRSHNERIRSVAVCKGMKQKHALTFSEGKENVKVGKLHDPDKVKYAIYEAVKTALEGCASFTELAERLKGKGVTAVFVHRGGDPEKEVQGLTFTMNGITLKASKIDRKFSYANLCKAIERNKEEREQQEAEHQRQMQAARNPVVYGIRLTDKQVQDIKDGEYVYLENMQEDDGRLFSGYLVMPDDMKQGWIYQSPPDRIVKEDKFYIREMDKLLADQGDVVRAKVRFWGPEQPESRQYFWKESTGFYDCSHDDPRTPKSKLSREEKLHVPSVTPKKKSQGPKL